MSMLQEHQKSAKVCFVTIGATTSFDSLIKAALSPPFLQALQTHGYTELCLQHGKEGRAIVDTFMKRADAAGTERHGINISGFDFNKKGLGREMRAAKGGGGGGAEGIVISHAGSGSILDALRIAVPIIVVPNPDLLDNHQVELAEQLAKQGYVVHGHLDDLPAAIRESEKLRKGRNAWPPKDTGADLSGKGLTGVVDDELGFVD